MTGISLNGVLACGWICSADREGRDSLFPDHHPELRGPSRKTIKTC